MHNYDRQSSSFHVRCSTTHRMCQASASASCCVRRLRWLFNFKQRCFEDEHNFFTSWIFEASTCAAVCCLGWCRERTTNMRRRASDVCKVKITYTTNEAIDFVQNWWRLRSFTSCFFLWMLCVVCRRCYVIQSIRLFWSVGNWEITLHEYEKKHLSDTIFLVSERKLKTAENF